MKSEQFKVQIPYDTPKSQDLHDRWLKENIISLDFFCKLNLI